ncbi:MAG TPA: HRDC domain-containing protein [Chthoniobacterales bacterium]
MNKSGAAELTPSRTVESVIDNTSALTEFSAKVSAASVIAVDTEADSLHSYREKLCLIQVSIPGTDEIIDPLADISLEPLAEALSDKEIVLQGADFDLRMLRRAGILVSGVFDTLIAARLSGETEVGYAALVQRFLGVELAKGSQKANWNQRPLPNAMIEYARNDTHYLLPLRDILGARLQELGREEWFRQSCEQAWKQAAKDRVKKPDELWRISGSGNLRGRCAAILRELWKWRELEAEKRDRPVFHILNNDKMIQAAIAIDAGHSVQLTELRGPRRQRFEEAVQVALAQPQSEWPQRIFSPRRRWTPEQEAEFDRLKAIRDRVAAEIRLDASLIAPRQALESIALSLQSPDNVLLPWQLQLLEL